MAALAECRCYRCPFILLRFVLKQYSRELASVLCYNFHTQNNPCNVYTDYFSNGGAVKYLIVKMKVNGNWPRTVY